MKKLFSILGVVLLLSACKDKKLIVFSKGKAEVNTDAKTIKATDGAGHEEKEVTLTTSDVTYKITAPAGEAAIDFPGDGLFIVNAKADTIVGGYHPYGDPAKQKVVTQVELKHKIDSMVALSENNIASFPTRSLWALITACVRQKK
jgi:hypothetical protein